MFRHRLLEPIKENIQKGNNLLFVYGLSHKDCYLYNFYEGILEANETYKKFFLESEDYGKYIHIIENKIRCYEFNRGVFKDITEEYFNPPQPKDDLSDFDDEVNEKSKTSITKEAKELQRQEESNNSKFKNNFNRLFEIIDGNTEKVALFFEDFDWMVGLYASNQDESLEFIKRVKDLSLISNATIILSLDDIEMIKRYNFNIEGNHCLYIGNPSAKEIKLCFLREYMKNVPNDIIIQDNLLSELEDISQAIASSNKELRSSMAILKNITSENSKIDKRDFEIAIEKIIDEKVMLDDIILDYKIKNEVENSVNKFLDSEDNKDFRKGLILTGPPGTGKTYLVKALANEKKCFFMAPTLSDLKGEYVGQSSAKVRKVFEQARANQPTIIFIDEADTVFSDRNLAGTTSDSYAIDMVNQFLVEIDGMKTGKQKVFVIAATNRVEILDSAIRSRLSSIINIGLPDKINRIELFDKKLENHNFLFKDKFYADEIATKTENMSGRDIDNFVKKLGEVVVDKNMNKISDLSNDEQSRQIFLEVLTQIELMTIEDLERKCSIDIKSPEQIQTELKNIIGYESIKNKIQRQVKHIMADEKESLKAKMYEINSKKGILLYGPPGNAKSKLAEAVAKENNLYLFKVISKDFTSSNMENQLKNLELIFESALRLAKMCTKSKGVLLFFDEFDSLASSMVLNQVVRGSLLDFISNQNGIRSDDSKVVFMAATNFYEVLDEALIRKGRIDEHIFMDNPTEEEGVNIISNIFNIDKNVDDIKEDTIVNIYKKKVKNIRENLKEQENEKLELMPIDEESIDNINKQIDKKLKRVRPSGAELVDLCNELKSEAYHLESIDINKKKIIINEETIRNILGE